MDSETLQATYSTYALHKEARLNGVACPGFCLFCLNLARKMRGEKPEIVHVVNADLWNE